jgi:hypothetical protein
MTRTAHSPHALRALLVAAALVCSAIVPVAARADATQQSTFQDDQYVLYSSSARVKRTLSRLAGLGVKRIRVNVQWVTLAPDPLSTTPPQNFNAADASQYPAANWAPYDRLVSDAARDGIGVDFNVTAPGPLWAMRQDPPTTRAANHWAPNVFQFYEFVYALGTRYSGSYSTATGIVPQVNFWAIWNEPNQPGWLAPQWRKYKGKQVINSPRLYREYANAAYLALYFSGHSKDTILIGELAPEGYTTPGYYTATTPMPFLRALYCLNGRYQRLTGTAAAALGCPKKGSAKTFVKANPALFDATGFAHHPYYFYHSPGYSSPDPNYAPLGNLGRLEQGIDHSLSAYGVHRKLPIYITEYGYQTNPPDPRETVTPAEQAVYLNEADYIAWRNRRVRSVAQFLLYDSAPNPNYPKSSPLYWDTFQTGLLYTNGKKKPAYDAYRMPIWIPSQQFAPGARTHIWGEIRPGPHHSQALAIQWKAPGGKWTTVARLKVSQREGYFTANVRLPGSGSVRSLWTTPRNRVYTSRTVAVSAG